MTTVGRLRVDGARELRRDLKAAGRDTKDLKEVHKKVATIVADHARPRTPVGPPPLHIRDTIRAAGTQSDAIVRVGKSKLSYAKPLHWGHKVRHKDGTVTKVKGQPWVYESAKTTSPKWLGVYESHVRAILNKVGGTTTP